MLNLSIMPLDVEHIEEICADVIEQQRTGVSTHAMFMMKFNPEGTPPVEKAEIQCEKYDLFRQRLDAAGAKHGVLVQATLGHIVTPYEPYPFQPTVSLVTGEESVVTACPLDPDFRVYLKRQMYTLARHSPAVVMIDDDMGLIYRSTKGCACKYHMAEFNRRAGTNMSREALYAHTQGTSEEDKRLTDVYVAVQRDALVGAARAMREGLDEADPTIQGVASGIYVGGFCEFSDAVAKVFAGEGNPAVVRLNGGPYARAGHRYFTDTMFRAAILRENVKDTVDIFLAETDTCPQNRYSTSAALLHAHFTASILEGATGAKHWITRLAAHEPASGKAYRKKLSKYAGFYEKLCEYTKELRPFGCRIPLTLKQDYRFVEKGAGETVSPWSTCVLERMGFPLYFSNDGGGAVFLDDGAADGFDDSTIETYMHGTLILSAMAADALNRRGFTDYTGVQVSDWTGDVITTELVNGVRVGKQYKIKKLTVCRDGVESLSQVIHQNGRDDSIRNLFPGVTRLKNKWGGEVIVFAGTPDMPFRYYTAFSMLNETRKKQFAEILAASGHLPVYYPEDVEVYVRAGHLENGEILCALFNISLDELEDIPLVCTTSVHRIEKLNPDGTRSVCIFQQENNTVRIEEKAAPFTPVILFLL